MLDKTYNIDWGDSHNSTTTTITEKRAPTDDSVRLLMEMEKKALDKILMCVKLDSNEFNARWHIESDYMSYNHNVICKFILNKREYEFEFTMPCKYCKKDEIVEFVRMEIIDKVSGILTRDLFMNNLNIIRDIYNV